MKNLEIINSSFEKQASNFESSLLNFSKEDYRQYTISKINPNKDDNVLETASGTCICGRSFAPIVESVVCLDATEAMLRVGKKAAEDNNLKNMTFVKGYAEELPFLEDSYDIVFTRLSFHHFTDIEKCFSEMVRVVKKGDKIAVIDMGACEDSLREIQDKIETLRDPSHVKNLSESEMENLFKKYGITIKIKETTEIPQNLINWMELTKVPENIQNEIINYMHSELEGKSKTGFYPYLKDNNIYFNQRWVLIVGEKI